jgi:hypothetical protein
MQFMVVVLTMLLGFTSAQAATEATWTLPWDADGSGCIVVCPEGDDIDAVVKIRFHDGEGLGQDVGDVTLQVVLAGAGEVGPWDWTFCGPDEPWALYYTSSHLGDGNYEFYVQPEAIAVLYDYGRATMQALANGVDYFLEGPVRFRSPNLNGDSLINISDLQLLAAAYYSSSPTTGDLNDDGVLNLNDISLMGRHMNHACSAARSTDASLKLTPELVMEMVLDLNHPLWSELDPDHEQHKSLGALKATFK